MALIPVRSEMWDFPYGKDKCRTFQLEVFAGMGVIAEATDEAWQSKCDEMGLR